MDKFGVVTSEAAACPICGEPVVRDGNVVRCLIHGTKPFEGNLSDETPEKHDETRAEERAVPDKDHQS